MPFFPILSPWFSCNQEWHHWDSWCQLFYCNTRLTWMHIWTMWSCQSELLSFSRTQEFGIPKKMLSVLLCSQSPNVNPAVAEELYVNWHLHVVWEELDLFPRSKMEGWKSTFCLEQSRRQNWKYCSRKAHSFLKPEIIFIQWSFHFRHRAPSIYHLKVHYQ